jgi:hypothetical protein
MDLSYAITLTTIPPRFLSVSHTITSWMEQDVKPNNIFIFVPKKYRRFKPSKTNKYDIFKKNRKKKREINNITTYGDILYETLDNDINIKPYIDQNILHIINVDKDWGPSTKLVEMLKLYEVWNIEYNNIIKPDYWIISDDDVKYAKNTISKYNLALSLSIENKLNKRLQDKHHNKQIDSILTHFKIENRISILINNEDNWRSITHVQGVDTILISSIILKNQLLNKNAFIYNNFIKILNFFHIICPDSYFQDDYIISLILNFGNINVNSVWVDNDNVAKHIEGVSKSNGQMHMHYNVFNREINTQNCIKKYADEAFKLINNNNNNYDREL